MATADQLAMRYIDPETGYLMMRGSQRPDGSWRKPRRVKDGYIPQDEVPLYESKGKQIAKARESGYIPGLHAPPPDVPHQKLSNFKIDTFVMPSPSTTIPGLNPDPPSTLTKVTSTKNKKKKNKGASSSSNSGVEDVTSKLGQTSISPKPREEPPVATDPAKKLRNLKKKLRDIEALQEKLDSGEIKNPEKEQLDKIARREEVVKEIEALEARLN